MDAPDFDPGWVLFYERFDGEIPDGGIAVGFADGHIEWIADQDTLDGLLDEGE